MANGCGYLIVENEVEKFLSLNLCSGAKLLLAFSGGIDSSTLLFILLKMREVFKFSIHLAHVDHGWRNESCQEAKDIVDFANRLLLPIYVKRLDSNDLQGNMEASSRIARRQFFLSLHKDNDFFAVLTGHHKDDQGETVFKQIVEGREISRIYGMQSVSKLEGSNCSLPIWRPLLSVNKKLLKQYAANKSKEFFWQCIDDYTNRDERYFRARVRKKIIPYVEDVINKNVVNNLCSLGKQSEVLRDYLEVKTRYFFEKVVEGPFGFFSLFNGSLHALEYDYILRKAVKNCEIPTLSTSTINDMKKALQNFSSNKRFLCPGNCRFKTITVDRGRIFFIKDIDIGKLSSCNTFVNDYGVFRHGLWKISLSPCQDIDQENLGWEELFLGKGKFFIDFSPPFFIVNVDKIPQDIAKKITKKLGDHKVPLFLREMIPIALKNESYREFFIPKRCKKSFSELSFFFEG